MRAGRHFVVDEELDRGLLDAIAKQDAAHIEAIPESKLQSGSSEIKNWIILAGAMGSSDIGCSWRTNGGECGLPNPPTR